MYYQICYGLAGAFLSWIIMWLDTKLLDNPKPKGLYLKNMIMVGLVTALIVSFIGEQNLGHRKMIGGGSVVGLSYISDIGEEIITGPPTF